MRLAAVLPTLLSLTLARDAKQLAGPVGYAGYPYHGLGLAGGYGGALPYYAGYAGNQYPFTGYPYTGYPYTGLPYTGYPYTIAAPAKVDTEESEVPAVSYAPAQTVSYPYTPAAPVAPYTPAAPVAPYTPAAPVAPYTPAAPVAPYSAPAPYSAGTQFHAQDEFGNLNYGYSNINSVKHEVGNTYGGVTGEYSYVDANGELQKVKYIADAGGFRVADSRLPTFNPEALVAPTFDADLPVAPVDTPEVAEAKAAHFAAVEAAEAAEAALMAEKADAEAPAERRKRAAKFSYGVTTYHPATGFNLVKGLPYPAVVDSEEEAPAVSYTTTPRIQYNGLPYGGYAGLPYHHGYGLGAGYGLAGLGYGLPYYG